MSVWHWASSRPIARLKAVCINGGDPRDAANLFSSEWPDEVEIGVETHAEDGTITFQLFNRDRDNLKGANAKASEVP